jgi:hypothetical protein
MRTEIGDMMREILKQGHEAVSLQQDGPFYVWRYRGDFFLIPWGESADYRWWYLCRPETDNLGSFIVFNVMYLEGKRPCRNFVEIERDRYS